MGIPPTVVIDAFYLLAFGLGAAVGVSELVSRYRDAPVSALLTQPSAIYISINAIASVTALALIRQFNWVGPADDQVVHLVPQTLCAGVGAMALFRSSLFTIRVGNSDIGIGPAAFLQILLNAADRATDRTRAGPRATAVQQIMQGISFQKASQALPSLCFGLMQNVSGDEQRNLGLAVQQLTAAPIEDTFKANSLGLALLNVVGDKVLRQAVAMLRADISAPPRAIIQSISTLQLLRNVDFSKSARDMVDECVFLTNKLEDEGLRNSLSAAYSSIDAMNVPPRQKALLITAVLIGKFGEDTVQTVLKSLPENSKTAALRTSDALQNLPNQTSSAPPEATTSGATVVKLPTDKPDKPESQQIADATASR